MRYISIGCGILVMLVVVGCGGNKEMAMQIMAGLDSKPPVKSVMVDSQGRTTTTYYDTTSVRLKVASVLMKDEALEWTKAFMPVAGSVGVSLVSNIYSTKRNADMWKGIGEIAGDRYNVDDGSNIFQGASSYSTMDFVEPVGE